MAKWILQDLFSSCFCKQHRQLTFLSAHLLLAANRSLVPLLSNLAAAAPRVGLQGLQSQAIRGQRDAGCQMHHNCRWRFGTIDSTLWLTACPHCVQLAFLSHILKKIFCLVQLFFKQLNFNWNKASFTSTKLYKQDWNFKCEHPLGHSFGNFSLIHIFAMGMFLNCLLQSQCLRQVSVCKEEMTKSKCCEMKINIVHLLKCLSSDSQVCGQEFLKYTIWYDSHDS